jgi:hypothetical protein
LNFRLPYKQEGAGSSPALPTKTTPLLSATYAAISAFDFADISRVPAEIVFAAIGSIVLLRDL